MLILAVAALALVLLAAGGIWFVLSMFSRVRLPESSEGADMESYLTEKWPVFQLRSWDPETGALELDYPLQFTYEQMEKYGNTLEELRELPLGNQATAEVLRSSAYESIGASIRDVTVYGVTSDGRTAYTLHPDGSVDACWDAP